MSAFVALSVGFILSKVLQLLQFWGKSLKGLYLVQKKKIKNCPKTENNCWKQQKVAANLDFNLSLKLVLEMCSDPLDTFKEETSQSCESWISFIFSSSPVTKSTLSRQKSQNIRKGETIWKDYSFNVGSGLFAVNLIFSCCSFFGTFP